MSVDPASHVRPDWWTDDTFLNLCNFEDELKHLYYSPDPDPSVLVVRSLIRAIWRLAKSGGQDQSAERVLENLQLAEANAMMAAARLRWMLSDRTDRDAVDELAALDRSALQNDPEVDELVYVRTMNVSMTLPGTGGDTASLDVTIDDNGVMTAAGNGPFQELDLRTLLDVRAAATLLEEVGERLSTTPMAAASETPGSPRQG